MLVNKDGQKQIVSDKINSKTHPHILSNLIEVKENDPKYIAGLYSIANRAKLKGVSF